MNLGAARFALANGRFMKLYVINGDILLTCEEYEWVWTHEDKAQWWMGGFHVVD